MSSFSKQHLIFMPENGKSNLKLTTDLKIQGKHEKDTCSSCKSREKNLFINMQSVQVQNSILMQQRECSNVWNETMDKVLAGNVFGKTVGNSIDDTVICLDDTVICLDDIEEIQVPTVLPTLSAIPPVKSKSPNTSINNTRQISTPVNNNMNLSISPHDSSISSETNHLLPSTPSKNDLQAVENATLDPATRNGLIYSCIPLSNDHVFWTDKESKNFKEDTIKLQILRRKIKNAKSKNNFKLLESLTTAINNREKEFVLKHIERVKLADISDTYMPMDIEERDAIYSPNDFKTLEKFHVKYCPEQKEELDSLNLLKSRLSSMDHIQNKFTPFVANELFYREHMYKKKYLRAKTQQSSPQVSSETGIVDTPHLPKVKSKKQRQQRLREKMNMKKRLRKLRLISNVGKANENNCANELTTNVVELSDTRNNNIITNIPNTVEKVISISNEHSSNASSLPSEGKKIPIVTSNENRYSGESSTPLKQAKFRPYRSLLDNS